MAFTGISYQNDKTDAFNSSLPRWQDGSEIDFPRSTTMGAPWGWIERENIAFFANLEHQLNDDWKLQFNARHNVDHDDKNGAEMEGAVDFDTHENQWWRYQSQSKFQESTFDLNLQGAFDVFGQRHDLILGVDHIKNQTNSKENWIYYADGNVFDRVAPPEWDFPPEQWETTTKTTNDKTGLYGALKFRPIEKLSLIAGGRYILKDDVNTATTRLDTSTNIATTRSTVKSDDSIFVPYYGLIYDINDNISMYASSTEIRQNQSDLLDVNGAPLDPIEGINQEVGIKTSWFDNQFRASIAAYKVKKEGEAQRISGTWQDSCCNVASGLYESEGFEVEFGGNLTDNWNFNLGYTYNDNVNKRNTDKPFNTYTPKHLLKIWTNYQLDQYLEGLEIGGGVVAQSENYAQGWVQGFNPSTGDYDGDWTQIKIEQPKYAIWSMRLGYDINPQWNVSFNLNNILDKHYYSTIGYPGYGNFYGEPRNFLLTLRGKY